MLEHEVLISTSSFGKYDQTPLRRLEQTSISYRLNPYGRTLTEAEVSSLLMDAEGLIAGTEPITRAVLEKATRLRAISRVGVGLDNVDMQAAQEMNINVFSTPEAPTEAVAELTMAGILVLLRRIHEMDAKVRTGHWDKGMGRLLSGKTVGIIGLGRIGKRLAQLLGPWDVKILAYDVAPDVNWAVENSVKLVEFHHLLSSADVVSIHTDCGPENSCLLGEREMAMLKPGAYLVNTARGCLVSEGALLKALGTGAIAGAYLDTFEKEPYLGPLAQMSNVLLTPHVGSYALEARSKMELEAVENLLKSLVGSKA